MHVAEEGTPEFAAAMKDAEYFVGFARESFGAEFYRGAPKLKLIQLISAGYDRLDIGAARQARVPVANNGGSNSVAVAEHTLMLILAVFKKLAWHHHNVITGKWRVGDFSQTRMYELAGKTLGIVGLGTIGKKVAKRAQAFDMHVQYYDIVRLTEHAEDALGVRFVLFPEPLRTPAAATLNVPPPTAPRAMRAPPKSRTMSRSPILINTSRGPSVDEPALQAA